MNLSSPLILVVDDTEGTRYSVARVLKNVGFRVIEAANGTDGLKLAREQLPDLAILDIHLPDMLGFEVCRRVKADPMTSMMPVLQISASYVTAKDKVTGLEGGADSYLTHPVEPQVLVATVRALLRLRDLNRNLRAIDERLQIVLRAAPIGLMELDVDLRLKWLHSPRGRITNSQVVGKTVVEAFPSEDSKRLFLIQEELIKSGGTRKETFLNVIDGEERFFDITMETLRDTSGAITGLAAATVDVTDRELARIESELAKELAESANSAKTQFIANVSHELRTPLGVILGFSDLILDGGQTLDENMASVGTIRRNVIQLSKLVDEVLDLSKVEADKVAIEMIRFDLIDLVEDVITLMGLRARENGIQLSVAFEPILPRTITSDPSRLRQILLNLIGNALKFTERGEVKLFVGVVGRVVENQPLTLIFEVSDTGIGISPTQASNLFNAFTQGDATMSRRFGGTGLGLMLSRKLAEALGGSLDLKQSEPGVGSTFAATITDPHFSGASGSHEAAPRAARTLGKSDILQGLDILLVEDSADNQIMIQRFLSFAGARVDLASDGRSGIEKAISKSYDVVLMDIQMPIMNGYEATTALRQEGYDRPIIALTAHALKGERERCLSVGFSDYMTKPIDRTALIAKVDELRNKI